MKQTATTTYIIACMALLLSSCGQEDAPGAYPDSSDRSIVFHTSLPELTTKASEIATEAMEYFYVTAYDVTDDKMISEGKLLEYVDTVMIKKSADTTKASSNLCVWPPQGQESDILHFFAFYPKLNDDAQTENITTVGANNRNKTTGYRVNDYRVANEISEQADFVTAFTTGSMENDMFSGIRLNFIHQLSRIEVKAKGSHKSCDIEIAGVQFGNVNLQGNFEFQTSAQEGSTAGKWTIPSTSPKETAGYIFREGDAIVKVGAEPVSIMGSKLNEDAENCAMLIPGVYSGWNSTKSGDTGMYLNVLLRILDKTPGGNNKQQYPYYDNSQGLNAMSIPVVYLAVSKTSGKVSRRLYKRSREDDTYYSDADCTESYAVAANEEVKEFGWAALPVSGTWAPGYIYTYTLDYSYGIGIHGPDVTGDVSPKAGDPVISDQVGVTMSVIAWKNDNPVDVGVPGN